MRPDVASLVLQCDQFWKADETNGWAGFVAQFYRNRTGLMDFPLRGCNPMLNEQLHKHLHKHVQSLGRYVLALGRRPRNYCWTMRIPRFWDLGCPLEWKEIAPHACILIYKI